MKNAIIAVVAAVIILGGGWYFYQKNQAKAPGEPLDQQELVSDDPLTPLSTSTNPTTQTQTKDNPKGADYTPPGNDGEVPAPDIQVVEIDYDGSKFTPSTVNIKVNDYVVFKNMGTVNFWPASSPHPVHTDYPGFDAGKPIAPGGKYQFQFTKVGSWGFHDHLNPKATGTVNVSK